MDRKEDRSPGEESSQSCVRKIEGNILGSRAFMNKGRVVDLMCANGKIGFKVLDWQREKSQARISLSLSADCMNVAGRAEWVETAQSYNFTGTDFDFCLEFVRRAGKGHRLLARFGPSAQIIGIRAQSAEN